MEVQWECAEPPAAAPPCDPPQPAGKINKAAFKLFGKRRSGSGMAGFFSFRNKGASAAAAANNNSSSNGSANENGSSAGGSSAASVELIRSKTHDGLVNNGADGVDGARRGGQEVGTVRSLSKSLSFFSLLRRGSLRASESGGAGLGRRGRGLKGLFSSIRWRRNKDKTTDGETTAAVLEGREGRRDEDGARPPQEEKDITLTLEPPPHQPQEDNGSIPEAEADASVQGLEESCAANVAAAPPHRVAVTELSCELDSAFPYTPTDSPLRGAPPLLSKANKTSVSSYSPPPSATPPPESCCGTTCDPPSEEPSSVDRLCSLLFTDVTSLKSFDSLTGCGDITADADEEGGPGGNGGGSGTSSSSSGGGGASGGAGGGERAGGGPIGATTSRGSPCKPPLPAQIYTTGAGQSSAPASLPARARAPQPPPPQPHPTGSGVVAYMGGGEEMASPEGVDDADMQGLWHMLPSTGDNSPALPPRSHQTPAPNPPAVSHHRSAPSRSGGERKPSQVKALGLSKIPVVGGGGGGGGSRAAKPPLPHAAQHGRHTATSPPGGDKEPLSDEGYWDTPSATPTATPDEGGCTQRSQKVARLSRDSCSGDHLYDLYNDLEEDGAAEDDLTSTPSPSTECKLSPPSVTTPPSSASSSSFRSMKGSASLPRDSKIPVSVRQATPPHSVSQSELSSVVEAAVDDTPLPKTEAQVAPPARTRIPVSKVPVRRSAGNAARGHRK